MCMRPLFSSVLLVLLLSTACGSDLIDVTSGDGLDQQEEQTKLESARALWSAAGVTDYSFGYSMLCECDLGPWKVKVVNDEFVGSTDDSGVNPAYKTINDVFEQIDATITEGRVPVRVTYDPESGVPTEFIWNEPELPLDGGFIWTLESFDMVDAA